MSWVSFSGVRVPLRTTTPVRPRFSLTSDIVSFRRCSRQYGFLGNDGFAPAQTLQVFYGMIIHQVLDRCHRHYSGLLNSGSQGTVPSDHDIEMYFGEVENALRSQGIRPVSSNIRNRALQIIQTFNRLEGPHLYPRVVDTEFRLESDRSQYIMRGVVDVIAENQNIAAGGREIWDYKGSDRPNASDPILRDYVFQMSVYAELYRARTGSSPNKAILYFLNELKTSPGVSEPDRRPPRAIYEVDFSNPAIIQDALNAFDQTAEEIINCKQRQNWPEPDRNKKPNEETCNICDLRWSCSHGPSRPRLPL